MIVPRLLAAASLLPLCMISQTVATGTASLPLQFNVTVLPDGGTAYRDPSFGVGVKLPSGWAIGRAFRWGVRQNTAWLVSQTDVGMFHALYFKMRVNPARTTEDSFDILLAAPKGKTVERLREGFADYQVRESSVVRRTVSGLPAVSCVADYTLGGVKMTEYLTWISGANAEAEFFARVATPELDNLRVRLDPIIETLILP